MGFPCKFKLIKCIKEPRGATSDHSLNMLPPKSKISKAVQRLNESGMVNNLLWFNLNSFNMPFSERSGICLNSLWAADSLVSLVNLGKEGISWIRLWEITMVLSSSKPPR